MSVALVTDSSAQLTPELAERFGARIVPVTVSIDGVDFLEGVELSVDDFYERLAASPELPALSTTQPSAAAFVEAFDNAVADGHQEILAVVVGSAYSGAVNSAELAARTVADRHDGLRIEVVDTNTASFGVGCAVWAAADVIAAGGDFVAAVRAAGERASVTSSVFVLDGLDLARRSGRFVGVDLGSSEVAVLTSGPSGLDVIGNVVDAAKAIDVMTTFISGYGESVVVAVGRAAPALDELTDSFRGTVASLPSVVEVVDYRVGASIAVHTGPSTLGAFVFPA